jgi:hypothetical protein
VISPGAGAIGQLVPSTRDLGPFEDHLFPDANWPPLLVEERGPESADVGLTESGSYRHLVMTNSPHQSNGMERRAVRT